MRWLTLRDHAEGEIRRKLARAGLEPSDVESAIERLRHLGYLDDARFARARAESLVSSGRLGPRSAMQRLVRAGVARELAQQVVDGAMEGRDELALALIALRPRHREALGSADPRLKARAARFLLGRGFSPAVIGSALGVEVEAEEP